MTRENRSANPSITEKIKEAESTWKESKKKEVKKTKAA